jgi:hypothetical protein
MLEFEGDDDDLERLAEALEVIIEELLEQIVVIDGEPCLEIDLFSEGFWVN